MTPSAVSQQLKALEQELRVELFDRSTRPMTPNSRGLQFLSSAHDLVRIAEDTVDELSGPRVGGTISIGSVRTSALSLLPHALVSLKEEFPDIKVRIVVGHTDELVGGVVSGNLDAALVAQYYGIPETLNWNEYVNEPLVVIAPPDTLTMTVHEMLSTLPYVKFSNRFRLSQFIEAEMARAGITPDVVAEVDTIALLVACVARGFGVAIVPYFALLESPVDFVTAPFGAPQISRNMGLIERKENSRQVLIARLHDHIATACGEYGLSRRGDVITPLADPNAGQLKTIR